MRHRLSHYLGFAPSKSSLSTETSSRLNDTCADTLRSLHESKCFASSHFFPCSTQPMLNPLQNEVLRSKVFWLFSSEKNASAASSPRKAPVAPAASGGCARDSNTILRFYNMILLCGEIDRMYNITNFQGKNDD